MKHFSNTIASFCILIVLCYCQGLVIYKVAIGGGGIAKSKSIQTTKTTKDIQLNSSKYNILCTASDKPCMKWGSYQVRCKDLQIWSHRCAPDVDILLLPPPHNRYNIISMSGNNSNSKFNATVSIKSTILSSNNNKVESYSTNFGTIYIDIVDSYKLNERNVPESFHVIVQNQYHADDVFPNRINHVVEHWFNSYPADMMSDDPVHDIPNVREVVVVDDESSVSSTLRMGTVWTRTNDNDTCPELLSNATSYMDHSNHTYHQEKQLNHHTLITYDCIDRNYNVDEWYQDYFTSPNEIAMAKEILNDRTNLGIGRLYFELFWKFDILIVPVKRGNIEKLRYGPTQRITSQFRSGVPTLIEIHGDVMYDFVNQYNYTCVYVNDNNLNHPPTATTTILDNDDKDPSSSSTATSSSPLLVQKHELNHYHDHDDQKKRRRIYWTFDEAVVAMQSVDIRKQCQQEGLQIAKDFTASRIAQKYLQVLGYPGSFTC